MTLLVGLEDASPMRTKYLQPVNIFRLQKRNQRTYYCPCKGRSVCVCVSAQIHIHVFIQARIKRVVHYTEKKGDLNDFCSILIYSSMLAQRY